MSVFVEDQMFNALAIRDTNNHNSAVFDLRHFTPKTLIVENGLNQQVDLQLEGGREVTLAAKFNVGSVINVAATTNDYATLSDAIPFVRLVASCATAPTTGTLTVYMEKVD